MTMGTPARFQKRTIRNILGRNKVAAFLFILLLLFLVVKITKVLVVYSAGTAPAAAGSVETSWSGAGLVVRSERTLPAPAAGWLTLAVAEGERVRPGQKICTIEDEDGRVISAVNAEKPGLISFQVDGEETLYPGQPAEEVWAAYRADRTLQRRTGERVAAGEPLGKLVDNYTLYVYVALSGQAGPPQGQNVRVGLPAGEFVMRAAQVSMRTGTTLVMLAGDEFPPGAANWRHLEQVTLAQGRHYGILVPARSIVKKKNGQTGVYLMVAGHPVYRPVQVVAVQDDEAVVSGVPVGARVVVRPGRLWAFWLL